MISRSSPVLPAAATTKIPESNASCTAKLVSELVVEISDGEPPKLNEIKSTFCVIPHHLIACATRSVEPEVQSESSAKATDRSTSGATPLEVPLEINIPAIKVP